MKTKFIPTRTLVSGSRHKVIQLSSKKPSVLLVCCLSDHLKHKTKGSLSSFLVLETTRFMTDIKEVRNFVLSIDRFLRACLHGGRGPQVGEVARLGGVTRLSI